MIGIEGYVVLATELLAIRQLVPFVGSGTEVVSIIISAVLMPLAVGYHAGGQRVAKELKHSRKRGRRSISIRKILLRNLLTTLLILVFGLSYIVLELFFGALSWAGLHNRILQTAIYSLVFLVTPTYLLAQTVPLISNYFSQTRLSEITGKMLFFSTAGSFLGSVVSTLVLMTLLGVHNTANITVTLLGFLIFLVTPKFTSFDNVIALIFVAVIWLINGNSVMHDLHVVADTPYSIITVQKAPEEDARYLKINRSFSSKFATDPKQRFEYIRYIEDQFINTGKVSAPREILVLGAGGFTVGWDDRKNHYTFVDIDPALQSTAEKYFLPSPLPSNKEVMSTSARAFIRRAPPIYDLVVIDVYSNIMSIPMETITREFLLDVKRVLKPGGIVVANVISSPNYADKFSVRYYHTFASVFPVFERHTIGKFDAWSEKVPYANTLYIYYNNPMMQDTDIYTDDKNTYSFDH